MTRGTPGFSSGPNTLTQKKIIDNIINFKVSDNFENPTPPIKRKQHSRVFSYSNVEENVGSSTYTVSQANTPPIKNLSQNRSSSAINIQPSGSIVSS